MSRTALSVAFLLCFVATAVSGTGSDRARITAGHVTTHSGISIHYLQSGSTTSDRALVLIPGWRLPAYVWTEQLETLSHITRVIAVDPRSQGESTKTPEGNSPESRARDLHEVLSTLGVAHPVLAGWSQGAHRDYSKVILAGIGMYAEHPAEYSRGMVDSLFRHAHKDLDKDKLVQSTLKTPTDIGIAMLVMDIFGADRSVALAGLDKPALVIASASSPLLDLQKAMSARIPGAQFVQIEDAGHAVFIDQPGQFDEAMRKFLALIRH